jgi:hypothetical protein
MTDRELTGICAHGSVMGSARCALDRSIETTTPADSNLLEIDSSCSVKPDCQSVLRTGMLFWSHSTNKDSLFIDKERRQKPEWKRCYLQFN